MTRVPASGSCAGRRVLVLSPTPTHPQDYGNRKRIFQICSRYAEEGARITFVHYPSEEEWRDTLPLAAERAMKQAWVRYYTIAPTRPPHCAAQAGHHRIDEWWDEAIGQFLKWLFSVQAFDIFIVNYSWLSKAFEYAPPWTFKILDTHDKVSRRREMLQSLGLDPEFFYTTDEEETVALRRADLVWAIKREEKEAFERMSPTPVLTVPHLDPARALDRAQPDPDGYFRIGVIGARNNVNRMNIGEFLKAAEPIFLESFAPVKIVVAGTVCDMLAGLDYPFLELRGRVKSVEEFYRTVDCVAIPMRASTGLKIKTGEALSLGMPVVSLAHAFEGYDPTDRLHMLEDFDDMARALVDLSFAPRKSLLSLADASRRSHARTAQLISDSLKKSDLMAREKSRVIAIAVDSRAFVAGSIFNLALRSLHEYLRYLANVTVVVVRGQASDLVGNPRAVNRYRRVIAARDLSGLRAEREALSALGVDVFGVETWLRQVEPKVVIVDALHPALSRQALPGGVVISRPEMIAFSQGDAGFRVPAKGFRRAFVAAPRRSHELAALAGAAGAGVLQAPCFCRSPDIPVAPQRYGAPTLAILGSRNGRAVALAVAMARAWGLEPLIVYGLGERGTGARTSAAALAADAFVESLVAGRRAPPRFALDLSLGRIGLSLTREVLERLHVPVLSASASAVHRSLETEPQPFVVGGERELWAAIRAFALEPEETHRARFEETWRDVERDRGWPWLWRYCTNLFNAREVE
ncbi:MAG TPA: glycosyltransferase family 4 protein, partial [Rhizomicrobium sp.]|nr:glycosyltransferase family 4 protein [Rhizomicrobium sp.]